jgi:hypothetical protein
MSSLQKSRLNHGTDGRSRGFGQEGAVYQAAGIAPE